MRFKLKTQRAINNMNLNKIKNKSEICLNKNKMSDRNLLKLDDASDETLLQPTNQIDKIENQF